MYLSSSSSGDGKFRPFSSRSRVGDRVVAVNSAKLSTSVTLGDVDNRPWMTLNRVSDLASRVVGFFKMPSNLSTREKSLSLLVLLFRLRLLLSEATSS